MTVTIVFGKTSDGEVSSNDSSYSTARNGPGDSATQGSMFYIGQNNNGGGYRVSQGFVGFDYASIPATESVVAAETRLYIQNLVSPNVSQDVEWRGYTWSGSGLTTADWRTPSQLAAARLDGLNHITGNAKSKFIQTSSDSLVAAVRSATSVEHVVVTSRQRAGTTPTQDEAIAISSADASGTTQDPALIYTSLTRHSLFGVLGAQVLMSDGWAYLESNGAATPTITLKHRATGGTVTTIATLSIGSGGFQFAVPNGAQAFALVKALDDSLFVISRYGFAVNSLAILGFQKGVGTNWTEKPMRTVALPSYAQSINNVAAVYHDVNGGAILAVASHIGSTGDSVVHNELAHVVFNTNVILTAQASSSPIFMSGVSIPSLQPIENASGYFNTWHNQTGTGLDVAGPDQLNIKGSGLWGYVYSFGTSQNLGDNRSLNEGRYILNTNGSSFTHTSTQNVNVWGRKDAGGKVRVVPVSTTAAAFISADSDSGFGLSISVRNHSGANAGSTGIGYVGLAGELIPSMPDGPAVGQAAWWDAVYHATDNKLWIYYVSATNTRELRRTAFDLDTMLPTLDEVLVTTVAVGTVIHAVRVQRNAPITQSCLVSVATIASGVLATSYVVDTFNAPPSAPQLTPRVNYDATQAALFAWTFSDPNGDAQSAYQLEISRVSDGVVALDTGKTASATASRSVAGATLTNGVDYRWRVKVWDTSDVVSEWSAYGTFSTASGGTTTITTPAADNPLDVITDEIPVSWSVTGSTQAAYRIWLYRGTTLVSDTGWIASTATSVIVSGMLSDQQHEIRVQTRNASAVATNTAVRLVKPSYSTPEKPVVSIQPEPSAGYVLLTIDNPAPGAPSLNYPEEDFEDGTLAPWGTGTGSTAEISTEQAHKGTHSLKLTATTGGIDPIYTRNWGDYRPVTPAQRYTARFWVYVNSVTNVAGTFDWVNGAFSFLGGNSFNVNVPANEWTQIQVTATAPAGAAYCVFGPSMVGGVPLGRILYLDEVNFGIASDRPDVSKNLVLRRIADTDDPFEVVGETEPDGTFRDYTATAGVTYEYVVRGEV